LLEGRGQAVASRRIGGAMVLYQLPLPLILALNVMARTSQAMTKEAVPPVNR
jgi:hypothetical protein